MSTKSRACGKLALEIYNEFRTVIQAIMSIVDDPVWLLLTGVLFRFFYSDMITFFAEANQLKLADCVPAILITVFILR